MAHATHILIQIAFIIYTVQAAIRDGIEYRMTAIKPNVTGLMAWWHRLGAGMYLILLLPFGWVAIVQGLLIRLALFDLIRDSAAGVVSSFGTTALSDRVMGKLFGRNRVWLKSVIAAVLLVGLDLYLHFRSL